MSDFEESVILKINELKVQIINFSIAQEDLKNLKNYNDDNPEQIDKIKEKFKLLNEQIEKYFKIMKLNKIDINYTIDLQKRYQMMLKMHKMNLQNYNKHYYLVMMKRSLKYLVVLMK